MPSLPKDPLLVAARVVLTITVVFLIIGLVALAIAFVAVLTFARADLLRELGSAGSLTTSYWLVVALLPLLGGILHAALRFVFNLRAIVRSVDEGDPFHPENAERLHRMGWLVVSIYVLGIIAGLIGAWLVTSVPELARDKNFEFDLGGGGILLMLVLFILARVFRHGARMRDELEGTV
ncbi:MAG: DUF2975 domain-containing protein [Cypionkella sp.]